MAHLFTNLFSKFSLLLVELLVQLDRLPVPLRSTSSIQGLYRVLAVQEIRAVQRRFEPDKIL